MGVPVFGELSSEQVQCEQLPLLTLLLPNEHKLQVDVRILGRFSYFRQQSWLHFEFDRYDPKVGPREKIENKGSTILPFADHSSVAAALPKVDDVELPLIGMCEDAIFGKPRVFWTTDKVRKTST